MLVDVILSSLDKMDAGTQKRLEQKTAVATTNRGCLSETRWRIAPRNDTMDDMKTNNVCNAEERQEWVPRSK